MRRILHAAAVAALAMAGFVGLASAQTCTPNTNPALQAGGTVFGRTNVQWNQYFAAKADALNGILCNPTIQGSLVLSGTVSGTFNLQTSGTGQFGSLTLGTALAAAYGGTGATALGPEFTNAGGTLDLAAGGVTNAMLANTGWTVNGTPMVLGGGPYTITAAASSMAVGTTTVTGGSSGRVLYDNGTLGELATSGTGNVALTTNPVFTTPNLGTPSAVTLTNGTGLPLTTGVTGLLAGTNGGTGVNNGSSTITVGGNVAFSGAHSFTGTLTADTFVTFPTTGTLAALNGTNIWTGSQTISGASFGVFGSQTVAFDWSASTLAAMVIGVRYANASGTITGAALTGTKNFATTNIFGGNTIAASSATTFTNYFGSYFHAPVAGTNVTITSGYALGADSIYAGALTIAPNNAIAVNPIGNPTSTLSSFVMQNTATQSGTTREYLVALGQDITTGTGVATPAGDKVALFVGARSLTGAGNGWAANFEYIMVNDVGGIGATLELDAESNVALTSTAGPSGLVFPGTALGSGHPDYVYGSVVTGGSGSNPITAGYTVSGGAAGFMRGHGCVGTVTQACLFDYTNSPAVLSVYGSHTTGIDLTNATISGNALALPGSTNRIGADGTFTLAAGSLTSAGDTGFSIKSSGTSTPNWDMQTVVSAGTTGRLRFFDVGGSGGEVLTLLQGSGGIIFDKAVTFPASTTGAVTPAFTNAPTGCTTVQWIGPLAITSPAATNVYLASCHS